MALDGPGWAGPGLFGRRGGFASIRSRFFISALGIVGGGPNANGPLKLKNATQPTGNRKYTL